MFDGNRHDIAQQLPGLASALIQQLLQERQLDSALRSHMDRCMIRVWTAHGLHAMLMWQVASLASTSVPSEHLTVHLRGRHRRINGFMIRPPARSTSQGHPSEESGGARLIAKLYRENVQRFVQILSCSKAIPLPSTGSRSYRLVPVNPRSSVDRRFMVQEVTDSSIGVTIRAINMNSGSALPDGSVTWSFLQACPLQQLSVTNNMSPILWCGERHVEGGPGNQVHTGVPADLIGYQVPFSPYDVDDLATVATVIQYEALSALIHRDPHGNMPYTNDVIRQLTSTLRSHLPPRVERLVIDMDDWLGSTDGATRLCLLGLAARACLQWQWASIDDYHSPPQNRTPPENQSPALTERGVYALRNVSGLCNSIRLEVVRVGTRDDSSLPPPSFDDGDDSDDPSSGHNEDSSPPHPRQPCPHTTQDQYAILQPPRTVPSQDVPETLQGHPDESSDTVLKWRPATSCDTPICRQTASWTVKVGSLAFKGTQRLRQHRYFRFQNLAMMIVLLIHLDQAAAEDLRLHGAFVASEKDLVTRLVEDTADGADRLLLPALQARDDAFSSSSALVGLPWWWEPSQYMLGARLNSAYNREPLAPPPTSNVRSIPTQLFTRKVRLHVQEELETGGGSGEGLVPLSDLHDITTASNAGAHDLWKSTGSVAEDLTQISGVVRVRPSTHTGKTRLRHPQQFFEVTTNDDCSKDVPSVTRVVVEW